MKATDYKKVEKTTRVEDCPGLFVIVTKTATGKLSRSYAFRIKQNKCCYKFSIGSVTKVKLADAIKIARQLSGKFALGEDVQTEYLKFRKCEQLPSDNTKKSNKPWTVDKLILKWTEFQNERQHWKDKKRSHATTIMAWVKNHLSPSFRFKFADQVTTKDVAKALHKSWLSHTSTPEKLLSVLDNSFDWGIRDGHLTITVNPAKTSYVRELLPSAHARPQAEHFPYLQPERMPEFMFELIKVESVPAKCLAFQILCALRIDNARSAKWNQVNSQTGILKIQRDEMKVDFANSPPHLIPLSKQAEELLLGLPRFLSSEGTWEDSFLFSNYQSSAHNAVTEQSIYKTIRTMNDRREAAGLEGWRDLDTKNRLGLPRIVVPHGLARTAFETWALDPVTFKHREFKDITIDYIMDHQLDNYRGAYKRRPPIGAMREVLQAWADFLFQVDKNKG